MNHDLYCDHTQGLAELLDGLSNGTLTPKQQVQLWPLLSPLNDLPVDFRLADVLGYRVEPVSEDIVRESWYCPVCSAFHSDMRELPTDE